MDYENIKYFEANKLMDAKRKAKELNTSEENMTQVVLEQYLKLNGRAETEDGSKILTPHDKEIGEDKIAKREILRKENLDAIEAKRKKKE